MKIKEITIKNFRLLEDIKLNVEEDITLIVGKNNTGKTSLFEIVNMFFSERNDFSFHDFSQSTYTQFEKCFQMFEELQNETDEEKKDLLIVNLNNAMPKIQMVIELQYDKIRNSLINISEFISDLDDNKNVAIINLTYQSKETSFLFTSFTKRKNQEQKLIEWLNDNITSHYNIKCFGGDNLIEENLKRKLLSIISFESVQASRKLDDTKSDNNKTLAVGFSDYYREKNKDNDDDVQQLEEQLKKTSKVLNEKYEIILKELLLQLKLFGVEPHISIPEIVLQAGFDPENILRKNIKYFYKQDNITLPENFNGLGYSNLIYLVLKVVSFIEKFKKAAPINKSETLIILIEEPEAHLHPQMQCVFISQIKKTIKETKESDGLAVQVIISTHSSHIVTEAGIDVERSFERIRYFSKLYFKADNGYKIIVKDFTEFKHKESNKETFRFLKQYMSLHRCDIFFADKVVLVEGTTEKILLPLMINKVAKSLNSEYVSIIEVGGAYAVKFKELLKFLNTKCLIITDIDSVDPDDEKQSCSTDKSNAITANSTLLHWIPKKKKISDLIECKEEEKYDSKFIRVAYQINEQTSDYVARSLEEAIINKNVDFFKNSFQCENESTQVKKMFKLLKNKDLNQSPYSLAPSSKQKTDFTFDLMTFNEKEAKLKWNVPKYIEEGLVWLALNTNTK